jgi:hypothetical protein
MRDDAFELFHAVGRLHVQRDLDDGAQARTDLVRRDDRNLPFDNTVPSAV